METNGQNCFIKRIDERVIFVCCDKEYELGSHPYEPCLYIKKDGEIIRTLHNAFDVYDLPERFANGEILTGIDGKEYDAESFCAVLKATLLSDRSEMDFPFAAGLVIKPKKEKKHEDKGLRPAPGE